MTSTRTHWTLDRDKICECNEFSVVFFVFVFACALLLALQLFAKSYRETSTAHQSHSTYFENETNRQHQRCEAKIYQLKSSHTTESQCVRVCVCVDLVVCNAYEIRTSCTAEEFNAFNTHSFPMGGNGGWWTASPISSSRFHVHIPTCRLHCICILSSFSFVRRGVA